MRYFALVLLLLWPTIARAQQVINMPNGVYGCTGHTFYDASDLGKKTVVAGVAARRVYVCAYIIGTGGTATTIDLGSGTGTDCVTTYTKITPSWQLAANDKIGFSSVYWNGLATLLAGDSLCVNSNGANAHQVELWYAIMP
jgi:hypothetical protein